jgi:TRAP-type uncharacterized transport system substrate-binding protein
MYPKLSRALFIAFLILLSQTDFAAAQAIPKSIQQGGTEGAIKERKNAWTVGIAGGLIDGTYMRFADELAKVLDDGDNLRILPMVSYGAASNLDDLLYLRGVDLAVTQSDVSNTLGPSAKRRTCKTGFATFCVCPSRSYTS